MADQQQHTNMNSVVEQEPLTGLNVILDTSTGGNTSKKSNALAKANPHSVSNINSNTSVNTDSKSAGDPKEVSMAEPNKGASAIDENLEVALPEGKDDEDRLDEDVGGLNMQAGIGEKKKKNKRKPKSQRGLVSFWSIVK